MIKLRENYYSPKTTQSFDDSLKVASEETASRERVVFRSCWSSCPQRRLLASSWYLSNVRRFLFRLLSRHLKPGDSNLPGRLLIGCDKIVKIIEVVLKVNVDFVKTSFLGFLTLIKAKYSDF